jgi:type I restriction enzyme S subunit
MAKLGDICTVNMGQSPDSATYNEVGRGLPFFQGNADFGRLHPAVRVWCSEPTKIAHTGDILISVRAPIGAMNVADQDCCIGRGLAAIRVNENICDPQYLWYAIQSKVSDLNVKGTGSTFKAISKSTLTDTEVLLVPLDAQKNIASVLSNVENSILFRKEQLTKLDELIKARFVEMFGTYPDNPFGWNTGKIQDVVSNVRYGSSRPAVEGGKYPYLRMNNITYAGELDLTDTKRIDVPDSELDKCTVQRGDVLFNRTNSKELVGKTCVYNRDDMMVLAGFVIRVRVNERILPEFLVAFLNTAFSKQMLLGMCKTAIGQANINAKEMQNIGLYIPPIALQEQFVDLKKQTDKSKVEVQKALDQTQLLFDSLMQQYFG